MRKIIIERMKQFLGNRILWQLKVNDNIVATLRNGQSITLEAKEKETYSIQCIGICPGIMGGNSTQISDIINIPADSQNYKLIAESKMMSIKLKFDQSE